MQFPRSTHYSEQAPRPRTRTLHYILELPMEKRIWTLVLGTSLAILHSAPVRPTIAQQPAAVAVPKEQLPEAIELLFKEIDEESLKEAPSATTKSKRGRERQVKPFKVDPKLLENKFVASARLMGMRNISRDPRPDKSMFHLEGQMVAGIERRRVDRRRAEVLDPSGHSLYSGRSSRAIIGGVKGPIRTDFSNVIPLCPKDELPSRGLGEFSDKC